MSKSFEHIHLIKWINLKHVYLKIAPFSQVENGYLKFYLYISSVECFFSISLNILETSREYKSPDIFHFIYEIK